MPLNGSGVFTRLHNFVTDRNNGVKIVASRQDAEFDGIATALSSAIYKDGQQTFTANQSMGGYKITSLGNASADTDALNRITADGRYLQIADFDEQLASTNYASTDVASATTTDIGAATTARVRITGTTTITSFGTDANTLRWVLFAGALTLTHNGTSLILPGAANITTVAGDTAIFASDGSGNWRCLYYQRATGADLNGLVPADIGVTVQGYDADTLKADTADVLTAGFGATDYAAGTKSSGTFTPNEANGNFQTATNGGAHTLAPPTNSGTITILYTNNGSAGTITTSGFTMVNGDSLDTVNGNEFLLFITKISTFSLLTVVALQ